MVCRVEKTIVCDQEQPKEDNKLEQTASLITVNQCSTTQHSAIMTCPHGCVDARYSSFQEIHGDQYIVISDRHVRRFTEGDQIRDKISQWLLAPDPSSNHIDAYDKLQESTGKWFVDGQQFSDWKNGPDSFILLYGIGASSRDLLFPFSSG